MSRDSFVDRAALAALPAVLAEFFDPDSSWEDYDDVAEEVWGIAEALDRERRKIAGISRAAGDSDLAPALRSGADLGDMTIVGIDTVPNIARAPTRAAIAAELARHRTRNADGTPDVDEDEDEEIEHE